MIKEYRDLTLEECKEAYRKYKEWFGSLSAEEQACIDDGGFDTFEDFNAVSWAVNHPYDTETYEIA